MATQGQKQIYIVAGPNGAGKTTFATTYLPLEAACLNFVNADLIAAGLSPFDPDRVRIQSGRLMLQRIHDLVDAGESFAFETTLSGLGYCRHIERWQSLGYSVHMYFLVLSSVELAAKRVAARVSEGGHDIPSADIRRRYARGIANFREVYCDLVDDWMLFENSGNDPVLLEASK